MRLDGAAGARVASWVLGWDGGLCGEGAKGRGK